MLKVRPVTGAWVSPFEIGWRGGAIDRAVDLRFIGRGFESCLGTIAQWPYASCLHLCASVTKQYNLVLVKGR